MKHESAARSTRVEPQEDGLDGLLHPSPPHPAGSPTPLTGLEANGKNKGLVRRGTKGREGTEVGGI